MENEFTQKMGGGQLIHVDFSEHIFNAQKDDCNKYEHTAPVYCKFRGRVLLSEKTSWVQLYLKILRTIYQEDKIAFTYLKFESDLSMIIKYDSEANDLRLPKLLADNIYVETHLGTPRFLNIIKHILDGLGIDYDALDIRCEKQLYKRRTYNYKNR